MEQTALRRVLDSITVCDEHYRIEFPPALTYGVVVSGGLVMSVIHQSALDFVSKSPESASHKGVLHLSLQFFRPTLATPQVAKIEFRVSNTTKLTTTLHVQLTQKKVCLAGYVTMTNLSDVQPGDVTTQTPWQLAPAPPPTTVQHLERESSPDWIRWHSPFAMSRVFRPQSYLQYHMPVQKTAAYINDLWLTPAWRDDELPDGAMWTNELVHFVLDNGIPLHLDVMDSTGKSVAHAAFVQAGRDQSNARRAGRSDQFRGKSLTESSLGRYSYSTIAITTDIKGLLPPNGVKWLFMRTTTTGILNNRMILSLVLSDAEHHVIASSQHVVQIIFSADKNAKKPKI